MKRLGSMLALALGVLFSLHSIAQYPDRSVRLIVPFSQSALATPELKTRLASLDMLTLGETGRMASDHLEANRSRHGSIVKSAGIKAD